MAFIKGKQIAANSIALSKIAKQDSGKILVGQGALTDIEFKAISGDASLANTGALTIAANAITETKIANLAISTAKIQNDAIDASKIADSAVGETQIANNAVTEVKLADLSVSTNKLQDDAVTTIKVLDANVTFAKLAADVWSNDNTLADNAKLPTSLAIKTYISNTVPTALTDTDDLQEGTTNLYFTDGRAQTAAVVNSTAGSETAQAPSVSAIKSYVDGKFETAVQGLDFHAACQTASSANVSLTTPGATINGFTFTAAGQRVLLKDQTDAKQNGIYDWNGADVALTRSADSDDSPDGEVTGGMLTFIEGGNLAGTSWVLNSPVGGVVIGTDDLVFVQFSSGAAYTGGTAIAISGLSINLDLSELNAVDALAKEDKLALHDVSTSSDKIVTVSNLASFLADGTTLTASNGKLTSVATGGSLKRDLSTTPTAVAANATDSTGLTISSTPASDSHVQVFINGLIYNLGGSTNSEVFFSADAGSTAKAIANIASGDTLFFSGTTCGHALEIDDVIQIVYQA